ncbi:MAG: hypothetical protein BZ138_06020 [Methanosphaera sp. rholeuAM270]|nr:MAG: hypothetical protein BZ138_06020 [Methanosphaera sp. rholeuAM270]
MAKVKFQQEIIRLSINGLVYQIRAEDFDWTDKQDSEEYTASESSQPYAVAFGKHEYSIDIKSIDPDQRYIFEDIMKRQSTYSSSVFKEGRLPYIRTYKYTDVGQVVLDKAFDDCYIEEISGKKNDPFDVKIKSLTLKQ